MVNRHSGTPLHKQVENYLRDLILLDEYQEGKLLPKELDLVKQLNVSRATVRQAISTLVSEGLVTRTKGKGTQVGNNTLKGYASEWKSFSQEMESRGLKIKNYELHLSWVIPPLDILNFFELKSDTRVLKLVRVRGNENLPFVHFTSYLNPKLKLTGEENYNLPLYSLIKDLSGKDAKISNELLSAENADELIAEKLWVELNSALLKRTRMVLDPQYFPLEYNIGLYRSDQFNYAISFK